VNGVAYVGAGNALFAFSTLCSGTCNPLWSYATGGQISSSPAVANGRVYIGSDDGKMYVLSTSGALLWSAATAAADSSSPTVANGVVYIGSGNHIDAFSASGCSAVTCLPLWTAPLTDSSFASPVVANGVVYMGEITNGQYLSAYKLP
jgi:outer membrane protein assembly factor BamB